MDMRKDQELLKLLTSWNLGKLYLTFMASDVNLETLKLIKPHHIKQLLKNFSIGTLINFESKLEIWRSSIGLPLKCYCNHIEQKSSLENTQLQVTNLPNKAHVKIFLKDILKSTKKGMMLKQYYEKNQSFEADHRATLINTILDYFIEHDQFISLSTSHRLENEIIQCFPNEKLTYYRTGKRGKIYNKASNKRLVTPGKSDEPLTKKSKNKLRESDSRKEFIGEDDGEIKRLSLINDDLSIDDFYRTWRDCSNYRISQILNAENSNEILDSWPAYKSNRAQKLITIDFKIRFPNANSIFDRWEIYEEELIKFLKKNVSCKNILSYLNEINIDNEGAGNQNN